MTRSRIADPDDLLSFFDDESCPEHPDMTTTMATDTRTADHLNMALFSTVCMVSPSLALD
jgi:hypothetical protein